MKTFRSPIAVVVALSLLAPVHPLALRVAEAQQPAKPKTVREELTGEALLAWDRAVELFNAKKWDGAQAEFMQAYRISKNPRVLFNVAMSAKGGGNYTRAIEILNQELSDGAGRITKADETRIADEINTLSDFVSTLTVDVNEPGAQIAIDGENVGVSPLAKPVPVTVGTHKVTATKAGFTQGTESVLIAGKVPGKVSIKIEASQKTEVLEVEVQGAPSALVKIDGKEVGTAPLKARVTVSAEPHVVEASATGFVPASQSIVVKEGDPRKVTLLLSREQGMGRLTIVSKTEGSTIEIDGKVVGADKWEGPVTAGPHQVVVRKKGFYTWNYDTDVKPGGERTLTTQLNEDRNSSFVPWLIGSIVVLGAGAVAAAFIFKPKDQDPVTGNLPPGLFEHGFFKF
jgi:hypothetical protein